MNGQPASFTYSTAVPVPERVTTSRRELTHIGVAFAVLTFDLIVLLSGSTLLAGGGARQLVHAFTPAGIGTAAAATFTGFVAHELAHKVVAQRRGFWAEFRAWPMGLVYSVVTAFLGVIMAAPGATVVGGMSPLDRASWGRTSLAGPMTNLGFGLAFFAGAVGAYRVGSWLFPYLLLLAFFNAWFGAFNLIPAGPLDGAKVVRWNRGVWAAAIAATGLLAVITGLGLFVFGTPLPPT